MKKRIFINPVIGDKATLLKSAEETHGELTLFEIEVAPGGGNAPHYHDVFTEKFTVLDGNLTVQSGKGEKSLHAGESYLVKKNELHCFKNKSEAPAKFLVELRPGHAGFEKTIAIAYGLAEDGLVKKGGIPKKFSHLAILIINGGTKLPGIFKLIQPLFRWVARRQPDVALALERKYC
jgi:quercetin dioxygenase-like cupin family protein